ncbi:MAG: extracellular solute-binding protein [Lachnospiraceae bacterium]|nr:extracellular solute-binding protein [Lachnospiraceae bacterium]
MKKRKWQIFLIVVSLMVCGISGCNRGPGDPEPTGTPFPTTEPVATATPFPTTTPVRNLNGLHIIIGDTYSPETPPAWTNAQEEAIAKYREEIMQVHNCTIVAKKVADWDKMQEVFINSVKEGEPVAQVFELDYRFIAKPLSEGLFYDLATLEELGIGTDDRERFDKWSGAVNEVMTKGDSIYGMRSEWMEPGGGIIFNKRLFEEAGLDPELLYDLQANGEWTWSKFAEICEILTRDTDGDGQTDVYATCSDGTDTLQCLVSSTGEDFIAVDKDGTIYNNCKSEAVLGAMEYAAELYEKGYEMPAPADEAGAWYITAFREGRAAMQFAEESLCKPDAPYGENNMTDEIGFVVPPKPDGQEEYYTYVYGNVWVIPSCYDAETAADIAFAYNLYTNETPGYNDEPALYQELYYSHFEDERTCDETLPYYNDKAKSTVNFLTRYLVDGLEITDLTKNYPFVEKTPEECVDEVWDAWQELIDESNFLF